MSKRVLYPPPLSRSPSFHMEGGFYAPLALVGWVVLLGASVWGTLMSKRVLYPPPLARSPSFHMEGGFRAPLALVRWVVLLGASMQGTLTKPASSLSSTASGPPPSTWKEAWGSATAQVHPPKRQPSHRSLNKFLLYNSHVHSV